MSAQDVLIIDSLIRGCFEQVTTVGECEILANRIYTSNPSTESLVIYNALLEEILAVSRAYSGIQKLGVRALEALLIHDSKEYGSLLQEILDRKSSTYTQIETVLALMERINSPSTCARS